MPPKGWRKNAEGKFPQNSKDLELVSIDDILFPKSTISKLAKNITNSENNDGNMILAKDSLLALQRSATVFVSHLMFHARQVAKDADRKNVSAQDILQGLEKADLSGFLPEVKQKLAAYEQNVETKKKQKADTKPVSSEEGPAAKKLKDNDKHQVVLGAEDDDENTVDDTDDEATNVEQDAIDEDNDHDVDDDPVAGNPIALLGQEEEELEGDKLEADKEEADKEAAEENGDSSDDEQ